MARKIFLCVFVISCSSKDGTFPPNEDIDTIVEALPGECDPGDCECLWCCWHSPIILDIEGDGFHLTNVVDGVAFDLVPDGRRENVAWTAPGADDAWLVLDRNRNGVIDNGTEMFGNYTDQPPPRDGAMRNGYAALAALDQDGDGIITATDPVYSALRLWRDTNHNGVSEPVELMLLSDRGIRGLGTDYRAHRKVDRHGNLFRFSAVVYRSGESTVGGRSFDVFLLTEDAERQARSQGETGVISMALAKPQEECGQDPCSVANHCGFPSCNRPQCKRCPTNQQQLNNLDCLTVCAGYHNCFYTQITTPSQCKGADLVFNPVELPNCTTP